MLIVEDDFEVAEYFRHALTEEGCVVVGPVGSAEKACELVKSGHPDVAILDVALTQGTSAPVARSLLYRNRPFVFVTGFSALDMLPDDLRGQQILLKPVDRATLRTTVQKMLASVAS